MDVPLFGSRTPTYQGIYWDEPTKRLHPAVIIICGSMDIVSETIWWWPTAKCELPGAQLGDNWKQVPPTSYFGDARPNTGSPDFHYTGHPKCLPPYPDQRWRWKSEGFLVPLHSNQSPSHALRINERASHIWSLHWWLIAALHWWLYHMLPRQHTNLYDQQER